MFKKYQRLLVWEPGTNKEINVSYISEYLGIRHKAGTMCSCTIILCQNFQTKQLFHIEPLDIIEIIDGID
jgi:hypothetical protein